MDGSSHAIKGPTGQREPGRENTAVFILPANGAPGTEADTMIRRLLLATSLLPWGVGWAQDPGTPPPATTAQEPQWSIPPRRLDFYAGFRSNGGTNFMMGAKYSRRLPSTRQFAGAGFFEVTFSNPTEFLLGGLFQYMPLNRLLLETGPGVALDGGSDFFWRVSGEYELRARRLFLIPKFYLDFVHGTTVVGYGIAIARH